MWFNDLHTVVASEDTPSQLQRVSHSTSHLEILITCFGIDLNLVCLTIVNASTTRRTYI